VKSKAGSNTLFCGYKAQFVVCLWCLTGAAQINAPNLQPLVTAITPAVDYSTYKAGEKEFPATTTAAEITAN